MKSTVVIKLGESIITIPRNELKEVIETADGLVFSFINGSSFNYYNQYLRSEIKQGIKVSIDLYQNAVVEVNLNNLKSPVKVELV